MSIQAKSYSVSQAIPRTFKHVFKAIKSRPLVATTVALYALEIFIINTCYELEHSQSRAQGQTPFERYKILTFKSLFQKLAKAMPQSQGLQQSIRAASIALKISALGCLSSLLKSKNPGNSTTNTIVGTILALIVYKLHFKSVQIEGKTLGLLLSEKYKQVKQQQDQYLASFKKELPDLGCFVKAKDIHTPLLVFEGFGKVLVQGEEELITDFQNRVADVVREIPLKGLTDGIDYSMAWLKTTDPSTWNTCKHHFDSFHQRYEEMKYCATKCIKKCKSQELKLMEEFAKVFHFKAPAGDFEAMRNFLNEANRKTLLTRFSSQRQAIDTIFTPDRLGKTPSSKLEKVSISTAAISHLLTLWGKHLDFSLQQGSLSNPYKELTKTLQRLLTPMELEFAKGVYERLQEMLNYDTALEQKDAMLMSINQWKNHIAWLADKSEMPLTQEDRFYAPDLQQHMVTSSAKIIEIANRYHQEMEEKQWLQDLDQRVRFDKKTLPQQSAEVAFRALIKRPLSIVFSPVTWVINRTCKPVSKALKQVEKMSEQGQNTFDEVMGRVKKAAKVLSGRHLAHQLKEKATFTCRKLTTSAMSLVTVHAKTD